jgi:hypothetical protein
MLKLRQASQQTTPLPLQVELTSTCAATIFAVRLLTIELLVANFFLYSHEILLRQHS